MSPFSCWAVLAVVVSVSGAQAHGAPRRLPVGTWGGEHARLTVQDAGARLELDCASLVLAAPISSDESGRVSAMGDFTARRPGPARQGEAPAAVRARIEGHLDGATLTMSVELVDPKTALGQYAVTLDTPARLRPCR